MSQLVLFLLTVAFSGLFTSRWLLRLAPLTSELPLKTLLATLLAALVGTSPWLPFAPSSALFVLTLIVAPLYVFGPLLLIALARAGAHRTAKRLSDLLYWTHGGRSAFRRLLAQMALQQGDADAALSLLSQAEADPLLLAQVYALKAQWNEVLTLPVPTFGDNAFLALDARVQAFLALGKPSEAAAELERMKERLRREPGPLAFRSVLLAEARIAAEAGRLEAVRETLRSPPPGTPPHLVFALAARAAEQSGRLSEAATFYRQAYLSAPAALRKGYEGKLRDYGEPLPEVVRRRPYGTLALLASLALAYLVQLWLDANFGPFGSSAGAVRASSVVGAFLLNLQGLPEANASWRYLSYAFVHGNLIHIAFNLWVLFDIGRLYETRRGWGNLLAAFALGAWMGAYLTVLTSRGEPLLLVGASGGVLGIAGALLADAWRGEGQDRLLTRSLVQWMVIIVLFSLAVPNVSLWGHVGGVIGGLLWGFVRQGLPKARAIDLFAGGVGLGVLSYALAQAARVFFEYVR